MENNRTTSTNELVKQFKAISLLDISIVGGKNSSLGEMFSNLSSKGIKVPDGFATTSLAYWKFLEENNIKEKLTRILSNLDKQNFKNLEEIGEKARKLIMDGIFSQFMSGFFRINSRFFQKFIISI
jgi:pyruvate,water dikinase